MNPIQFSTSTDSNATIRPVEIEYDLNDILSYPPLLIDLKKNHKSKSVLTPTYINLIGEEVPLLICAEPGCFSYWRCPINDNEIQETYCSYHSRSLINTRDELKLSSSSRFPIEDKAQSIRAAKRLSKKKQEKPESKRRQVRDIEKELDNEDREKFDLSLRQESNLDTSERASFDVQDLLYNVSSLEPISPQTFYSNSEESIAVDVKIIGHQIMISTENHPLCNKDLRGLRMLLPIGDERIKKVRHEIVSSYNDTSTDVPFSVIDPNYTSETAMHYHNLTPDYYDASSRRIGELGTSMNEDENAMARMFRDKDLKYSPYLKDVSIKEYYIFIVTARSVFSNYPLEQWHVNLMTARFRLGLLVESKIVQLIGYDVFRDEDTNHSYDIVKQVLSSIKMIDLPDIEDMEKDFIMDIALSPITKDERIKALTILSNEFKETAIQRSTPKTVVDDYKTAMRSNPLGCRPVQDMKRITNFPFVMNVKTNNKVYVKIRNDNIFESNAPAALGKIWHQCFQRRANEPVEMYDMSEKELNARSVREFTKHHIKQWHAFPVELNYDETNELSLSGVMAKVANANKTKLSQQEKLSHIGFDPESNTEDISQFILSEDLTGKTPYIFEESNLGQLLSAAKGFAHDNTPSPLKDSLEIFSEYIATSEFVIFADMISCFMEEIAYCMKHWNKKSTFMYRYLKYYRAGLVVYNSGSHIFVSYCFEKTSSKVFDTGKLGPKIYSHGDIWISDWCSYDKEHVEHYLKAGPYMAAIMSRLMSSFGINPFESELSDYYGITENAQYWSSLKNILLIFLNNKLNTEEIITAQRYFFMSLMDEFNPDPYKFITRLPEVLRSRLACYYTQKTFVFMDYYKENRIKKGVENDISKASPHNYENLRNLFCEGFVSIDQLIDSFYYGYVVSKSRASGVHNQYVVCKKLFSEEEKFLKMKASGKRVIDDLDKPEAHRRDKSMLKYMLHSMDDIFKKKIGDSYLDVLKRMTIDYLSKSTFSDMATLKVSSRDCPDLEPFEIDEEVPFLESDKKLREKIPSEYTKRPKMIERMIELAQKYEDETGSKLQHLVQLLPMSLERLEKKNGFDSDLFSKSQHGGHREIHVLEADARICQYHVEAVAKTLCKIFPSETITHPKEKGKFVANHYKNAMLSFDDFVTFGKSADAKTWCQNHFVSTLCIALIKFSDPIFHAFLFRVMRLWVNKKVSLPASLILNIMRNSSTASSDPVFISFREKISEGKLPFLKQNQNKAQISSGMFQGIFHYASSFYHTIVQEVFKKLEVTFAKQVLGIDMLVTKVQGSDDSGSLNSIAVTKNLKSDMRSVYRIMQWKERVAAYVGIINSPEKSVLCAMFLIEYNSEWFVRQKSLKPTFRWTSACMETTLVETFISRYRIFTNTLTQCLEGGASTIECSLTQMSQAWMHYKLLGLDSSPYFDDYTNKIQKYPSPTLGFFPLDPDVSCGLTGFDFSLFLLARNSKIGDKLITLSTVAETPQLEYEGRRDNVIQQEARKVSLKFTDDKIHKTLLKKLPLPSLDECIEAIEANPDLIFGSHKEWEEDKINITLKLYSPGVKESLSQHSSLLRMFVASAYIMNCECFTLRNSLKKESLMGMLNREINDMQFVESTPKRDLSYIFPNVIQYEETFKFLSEVRKYLFITEAEFTRKSKISLTIFTNIIDDEYDLLKLCKQKWFNKRLLPLGRTHFAAVWNETKNKYKFLRDTLEETKLETQLDNLHLKYFLESITAKSRKVTLSDTNARNSSFKSTVTRIFWPSIKIMSSKPRLDDVSIESLRSTIFAVMNFFFNSKHKESSIAEILMSSDLLKEESAYSDPRLKSLKLIRDALQPEMDAAFILEKMKYLKKAVLGFFSERQRFDPRTKKRTGKGQWRGLSNETSIEINILGEKTSGIVISSVNDFDHLGHVINNLLREIHAGDSLGLRSKNNLYLNERGRFVNSASIPSKSIPVTVNEDLRVNIIEMVQKSNWYLRVSPYNIRLSTIYGDSRTEVTLLSEPFTSKDWSPETDLCIDSKFLLSKFHKGMPPTRQEWCDFFETFFPLSEKDRIRFYTDSKKTGNFGIYDIREMKKIFVKQWDLRKGRDDVNTYTYLKSAQKTMEEDLTLFHDMDTMMYSLQTFSINIETSKEVLKSGREDSTRGKLSWDESILEEETLNVEWMDTNEISNLVELMKDANLTALEKSEMFEMVQTGMPSSNKFFIETISHIERNAPSVTLEDLDAGVEIDFPNPFGKVISIIFHQDYERRDYEDEIVDAIHKEMSEYSTRMSYATHMTAFSKRSVDSTFQRIEALKNLMYNADMATKNMAMRRVSYEYRVLNALLEAKSGATATFMNIEALRKKDFVFNFFTWRIERGMDELLVAEFATAYIGESLESTKTTFSSIVNRKLYANIQAMEDMGMIDSELAGVYRRSTEFSYMTEAFLDLICVSLSVRIRFTRKDAEIFRISPSFAVLNEDDEFEPVNKITCDYDKLLFETDYDE